jgi:hypothetical protein
VQQHEDLLDRSPRQLGLGEHPLAEHVDALGVDRVQQCVLADLGEYVARTVLR